MSVDMEIAVLSRTERKDQHARAENKGGSGGGRRIVELFRECMSRYDDLEEFVSSQVGEM